MKLDASVNMFIAQQNINNFSICIPAFCLVIKRLDMKWFYIGFSISCGRHWSIEIINLVAQFFFYHPSKFNHMFSSRFIYLNCINIQISISSNEYNLWNLISFNQYVYFLPSSNQHCSFWSVQLYHDIATALFLWGILQ